MTPESDTAVSAEVPMDPLRALADEIELDLWSRALAATLFADHPDAAGNPGRLRVLGLHARTHAPLRDALASNAGGANVEAAWRASLASPQPDLDVFHALAVLQRETAMLTRNSARAPEHHRISTALWMSLLACAAFRTDFSHERMESADGTRIDLAAEQREQLWQRAMQRVLGEQKQLGTRALWERDHESARVHAQCLVLAGAGAEAWSRELERHGIPFRCNPEAEAIGAATRVATTMLEEWAEEVIHDAQTRNAGPRETPPDPDPEDPAAFALLDGFVALGIPAERLLRVGLAWHYPPGLRCHQQQQMDRLRALLRHARLYVDGLAPLVTKGRSDHPSNIALAMHCLLEYSAAPDRRAQCAALCAALRWCPMFSNALDLVKATGCRCPD